MDVVFRYLYCLKLINESVTKKNEKYSTISKIVSKISDALRLSFNIRGTFEIAA